LICLLIKLEARVYLYIKNLSLKLRIKVTYWRRLLRNNYLPEGIISACGTEALLLIEVAAVDPVIYHLNFSRH
jgi:hypothetical protein